MDDWTTEKIELDPTERMIVATMVEFFVFAESNGYCFDVLVRRAIEEGERRP